MRKIPVTTKASLICFGIGVALCAFGALTIFLADGPTGLFFGLALIALGAAVAFALLLPIFEPVQNQPIGQDTDRESRKLTEEEIAACVQVIQQTKRPYMKLVAARGNTDVFSSKFGGTPYLPPGFAYPHNTSANSDKEPLKLLCQLNFAQLPPLEGFPNQGILQFYLAHEEKDDIYGVNFDDLTKQEGWRVVYHEEVLKDESQLQYPPDLAQGDEVFFPFGGEFSLTATQESMPITPCDFGWQEFWQNTFEDSPICQQLKTQYAEDEIADSIIDAFYDSSYSEMTGHRIGGYPYFTQYDPREGSREDYSVLLLQIDSEDEIMWGDVGVANFFITSEALKNLDFSKVLYNWDCH